MLHQLLALRQQEQTGSSQRKEQNQKHDRANQAAALLLLFLLALHALALLGLADRTLVLFLIVLVIPLLRRGLSGLDRRSLSRRLSGRTRSADGILFCSGSLNRGLNNRLLLSGKRFLLAIKLFKSLLLCSGAPAPARSGRSILQFIQI